MNTLLLPSTHVDKHTINLLPLQKEDLKELAQQVAHWQKNPLFMRFLKERPMTAQQNLNVFLKDFDTPHCTFRGIQLHTAQDLLGFLLLHNFDEKDHSLELGFRVDPKNQARGVCTQAVKSSLPELLQNPEIADIVGWHSAMNQGSFKVFQRSGFQLDKFVPQQTFLPNINHLTDDFRWRINQTLLVAPNFISQDSPEKEKILQGIVQHNLSFI